MTKDKSLKTQVVEELLAAADVLQQQPDEITVKYLTEQSHGKMTEGAARYLLEKRVEEGILVKREGRSPTGKKTIYYKPAPGQKISALRKGRGS